MKRTRTVVLATAGLALLVTGCTAGAGTTDDPPAGTNRPAAESDAAPADTTEETTAAPAANPRFGETYTWEDGLAVTVSAPEPFTRGQWAAGGEGAAAHVRFTITIVNATQENVDPALFYATLQSANVEADQVFDSDSGLTGGPSTTLLPGREVAFTIGFGVSDPADLVLEITPGMFEYESAIFTS